MKKVIRLTESDLVKIIKRFIKEGNISNNAEAEPSAELIASLSSKVKNDGDDDDMTQQVAEDWYRRRMNKRR